MSRNVEFKLLDVAGKKINDNGQLVFFLTKDNVTKTQTVDYDPASDDKYSLPQFPHVHFVTVDAQFKRYQVARNLTNLAVKESDSMKLLRLPNAWAAKFDSWEQLSVNDRFSRLIEVLMQSSNIDIPGRGVISSFTEDNYNNLSGDEAILSKACLLNLYARLTDIKSPFLEPSPWFSFVEQILTINRERFLAIARRELYDIIKFIVSQDSTFKDYESSPPGIHFGNIPVEYRAFIIKEEMVSIKSTDPRGNIQLTISVAHMPASAHKPAEDIYILDADIDESKFFLAHLVDIVRHKFNGGTHPYQIHEYIVAVNPAVELGYKLI